MTKLWMAVGLMLTAAPLLGQQATQKFEYRPVHQVQEVGFQLEKIWVRRVSFRPGAPPPHRAVPEAVVRIENESDAAAAVGVAIVLFDADGNIVAAGAGGTRVGWLAAGERDTSIIRFPYVFRNLDKARTFTMTMEIQKKEPSAIRDQSQVPEPKTEN
jgi:hypothetical protein